jgi:hypothetical protein
MTVKRRRYGKGYGYTVDGEKWPGVTKVCDMLPSDNLVSWAARETARYAVNNWSELAQMPPVDRYTTLENSRFQITGPAARKGTEVHLLAAQLGDEAEVDLSLVPDDQRGYVTAYRDFMDAFEVAPVEGAIELVVASRVHRYCGTADLVADLGAVSWEGQIIPPCRWLLDIKSGKRPWWTAALQTCAYKNADVFVNPDKPDDERPMEWLEIARCGVVHVQSDDWALYPLETGPEVWETFLHLRWLYDRYEPKTMHGWLGTSAQVADLVPAAAAP